MQVPNKSKKKGTEFESKFVRYLRDGLDDERPERLALHGAQDHGDVGHIHKQVTSKLVAEWREQTLAERENTDADFALLVVDVYGKPMGQSQVHVTIRDLARICLGMRVATTPNLSALYDGSWVVMSLDEAIYLMRGV